MYGLSTSVGAVTPAAVAAPFLHLEGGLAQTSARGVATAGSVCLFPAQQAGFSLTPSPSGLKYVSSGGRPTSTDPSCLEPLSCCSAPYGLSVSTRGVGGRLALGRVCRGFLHPPGSRSWLLLGARQPVEVVTAAGGLRFPTPFSVGWQSRDWWDTPSSRVLLGRSPSIRASGVPGGPSDGLLTVFPGLAPGPSFLSTGG